MSQAANLKRLTFVIFTVLDNASKMAFSENVAEALHLQMQCMQDGMFALKQLDKFRKLGSDAEARVKNDVRSGVMMAYLKQVENLNVVKAKARARVAALETTDGAEYSRLKDITRPFLVPEDMIASLLLAVELIKKEARAGMEELSSTTGDLHIPATSWRKDLKDDPSLDDVKTCVATFLDEDVSSLEPNLAKLKEAFGSDMQQNVLKHEGLKALHCPSLPLEALRGIRGPSLPPQSTTD